MRQLQIPRKPPNTARGNGMECQQRRQSDPQPSTARDTVRTLWNQRNAFSDKNVKSDELMDEVARKLYQRLTANSGGQSSVELAAMRAQKALARPESPELPPPPLGVTPEGLYARHLKTQKEKFERRLGIRRDRLKGEMEDTAAAGEQSPPEWSPVPPPPPQFLERTFALDLRQHISASGDRVSFCKNGGNFQEPRFQEFKHTPRFMSKIAQQPGLAEDVLAVATSPTAVEGANRHPSFITSCNVAAGSLAQTLVRKHHVPKPWIMVVPNEVELVTVIHEESDRFQALPSQAFAEQFAGIAELIAASKNEFFKMTTYRKENCSARLSQLRDQHQRGILPQIVEESKESKSVLRAKERRKKLLGKPRQPGGQEETEAPKGLFDEAEGRSPELIGSVLEAKGGSLLLEETLVVPEGEYRKKKKTKQKNASDSDDDLYVDDDEDPDEIVFFIPIDSEKQHRLFNFMLHEEARAVYVRDSREVDRWNEDRNRVFTMKYHSIDVSQFTKDISAARRMSAIRNSIASSLERELIREREKVQQTFFRQFESALRKEYADRTFSMDAEALLDQLRAHFLRSDPEPFTGADLQNICDALDTEALFQKDVVIIVFSLGAGLLIPPQFWKTPVQKRTMFLKVTQQLPDFCDPSDPDGSTPGWVMKTFNPRTVRGEPLRWLACYQPSKLSTKSDIPKLTTSKFDAYVEAIPLDVLVEHWGKDPPKLMSQRAKQLLERRIALRRSVAGSLSMCNPSSLLNGIASSSKKRKQKKGVV